MRSFAQAGAQSVSQPPAPGELRADDLVSLRERIEISEEKRVFIFAEYSAGGAVQLQIAFLDDAFMRLPRAFDAISQFAAFVGKRPDDFVIPFGSSVADAAAEAHQLPGSKLMFHASLQFFDASLRQRCAAEEKK